MKTRLKNRLAVSHAADEHPIEYASVWLGGGSLLVMAVGVLAGNPVVAGCGAIMVGLLILFRLRTDLRSGVTSSNWGSWRRDENRIGFRCNISLWSVLTLACFLLGVFTILGWVHLPSTSIHDR